MAILDRGTYDIYYEVHGEGPPAVVMGGWGTFCHGQIAPVPRTLMKNHQVVMFDYPGIGQSSDDLSIPSTIARFAADLEAILDRLELKSVHMVGMIGVGACIGQELAINRPDLVKSLFMAGTWAKFDQTLRDQVEGLRAAFFKGGFELFQLLAASLSFAPDYYNEKRAQIIGPRGAWCDLMGREKAFSRIVDACLSHDTTARLRQIKCPTLVIHGGQDIFTAPRLTRVLEKSIPNAIGYEWPELFHIPSGGEEKMRVDRILAEFHASVA